MTDLMYSTEQIPDEEIMKRAKAYIENDPVLEVLYGDERVTRSKLYERLRKRSYRKYIQSNLVEDAAGRLMVKQHEKYLDGVRDALLAIRNA